MWSRDLAWSLLRWIVLFVLICGHSSSLASGSLSVFLLVLWVPSLPHGKMLAFSRGCAVMAGSSCKVAKLIHSFALHATVAQGALGGPVDLPFSALNTLSFGFIIFSTLNEFS